MYAGECIITFVSITVFTAKHSTSVNSECVKDNIEFVNSVFTMDKTGIGQCLVALAGVGAVLWIVFLVIVVRATNKHASVDMYTGTHSIHAWICVYIVHVVYIRTYIL